MTSTLAIRHVPARRRQDALAEIYRVTKPGGRLLLAGFDPARPPFPLHPGAKRTRRAAASVGSLEELAVGAGYQIESTGVLPLLRYVTAVRPFVLGVRAAERHLAIHPAPEPAGATGSPAPRALGELSGPLEAGQAVEDEVEDELELGAVIARAESAFVSDRQSHFHDIRMAGA